ncbi:MAG: zinc ribbon domain-containing protein [Deltaproteobacteria bacterium]|nr:zinc ribbon domain-containing protein [Deltaproteobacteria bacterium]
MPIYEYECEKCGSIHEILQKIADKPLVTCPGCKGRLHKRISQCTFHLKGTGWYATDYAKSSGGNSAPPPKKNDSSVDKASSGDKATSDKKSGADSKKSTETKKN